jgi:hypothetical protein
MFILLHRDNTLQIRFKLILSFIIINLNFLRKGMYVYTFQGINFVGFSNQKEAW